MTDRSAFHQLWFAHFLAAAGALLVPLPCLALVGGPPAWELTAAGLLATRLTAFVGAPLAVALALAVALLAALPGAGVERFFPAVSRETIWGGAGLAQGALFGASQGDLATGSLLALAAAAGGVTGARASRRQGSRTLTGIALVAAVIVAAVLPASRSAPRPRRLILITIDTLRADHLSGYGYRRATTPNLDRLAAGEATLFTRVYSSAPWTLPSLTSIMTSLQPPEHRVIDEGFRLSPQVPTVAAALTGEGWLTAAFVSHLFASSKYGLDHGFLEFNEILPEEGAAEGYVDAGRILGRVRTWIAHHAEQRFFLFVHLFDPHFDYAPPPPFDRQFVDPGYRGVADGSWSFVAPYAPRDRLMSRADLAQVVALYDGEIRWTDDQLGRLFAFLERLGLWRSTALVVTADHGEEFQEHGSIHHTKTLYEEVLRVPLIVKLPGGRGPESRPVVDEQVRTVDVAPTLLDLAGVAPPPTFEGSSLLPLVQRPGKDRPAFAHTVRYGSDKAALILGDDKLIYHFGGGYERFDLASDPGERRPLEDPGGALGRQLAAELARMKSFTVEPGHVELTADERRRLEALGYVD